jgi:hypothetical protein
MSYGVAVLDGAFGWRQHVGGMKDVLAHLFSHFQTCNCSEDEWIR